MKDFNPSSFFMIDKDFLLFKQHVAKTEPPATRFVKYQGSQNRFAYSLTLRDANLMVLLRLILQSNLSAVGSLSLLLCL